MVLLEVPAAPTAPVEFERTAYDRIGSATPRLADNPDRQRALWDQLRSNAWETGVALPFADEDAVLARLDVESYFQLLGLPPPDSVERTLSALAQDQLIASDVGGKWNIHNLGAILFAKDLRDFQPSLARKAVRFVVYDGDGRAATVTHPAMCRSGRRRFDGVLIFRPKSTFLGFFWRGYFGKNNML